MPLRGEISLRNDLLMLAEAKGSVFWLYSRSFLKFVNWPWAVSGRR